MAASKPGSENSAIPNPAPKPDLDSRLDEALEESFPASDPPAITPIAREHEYGPDTSETENDI